MGPANMQFQSAPKDFEKKPNSNGKVTRSNLWFFFGDVGASQGFDALKISEFPTTLKSCPEVLGGSIVTFVDTKQVLFHPNPDPSQPIQVLWQPRGRNL